MLEDSKNSSEIYHPSNYWNLYEKKFISELRKLGLQNFRRRKNSILSSFSGTDLLYSLGQINLFKYKISIIEKQCQIIMFGQIIFQKLLHISRKHSQVPTIYVG